MFEYKGKEAMELSERLQKGVKQNPINTKNCLHYLTLDYNNIYTNK